MYSPQGTVYLGHVPWNNNYKHVYHLGLSNAQDIIANFCTMQTSEYTYLREDTDIRVPYNADSLYGVNYCVYQNTGKWFFCFVNTITFVNNNTSLLHLEEDLWQTWGGSLVWKTCFVARQHVSQDNLGQWRAPEPSFSLEGCTVAMGEFSEFESKSVIVATCAIPHLKPTASGTIFNSHSDADFDGSDSVAGGFYGTIFNGAKLYGFDRASAGALVNFLDNLNKCGAAESVCAMYMVPTALITVGSDYSVSGMSTQSQDGSLSMPVTMGGGYAPRNNKCLTYPYHYVSVSDYTGGEIDLKLEDFATFGQFDYRVQKGLDTTSELYLVPRNYQGQSANWSYLMPLSGNAQCSWVYDAFHNWAAQNAEKIGLKEKMNLGETLIGGGVMLAGAVLALSGVGVIPEVAAIAGGEGAAAALGLKALAGGAATMGKGVIDQASMAADIDAQSKVPNHTVGGSSNNSLQSVGHNEGLWVCHSLQINSARRLDWFFDMYGYQIDQLRLPNITSRPSWNYLQTVGANMQGEIPADRLSALNACLDNGITFWHTTDVGNYGLGNRLE